jgi:hypothetical protein
MPRLLRIIIITGGICVGLFMMSVMAIGVVAYRAGVAIVKVHAAGPEGTRLNLPVPMILVDGAVLLTPREALPRLPSEATQAFPFVAAMMRELESCPDAVFIEVHDGDDHVVIAKRNGRLRIDVHDGEDRVSLSLPAHALRTTARLFERMAIES